MIKKAIIATVLFIDSYLLYFANQTYPSYYLNNIFYTIFAFTIIYVLLKIINNLPKNYNFIFNEITIPITYNRNWKKSNQHTFKKHKENADKNL